MLHIRNASTLGLSQLCAWLHNKGEVVDVILLLCIIMHHEFLVLTMKKRLNWYVYIHGSYRKIKTGVGLPLFGPLSKIMLTLSYPTAAIV